MTIWDRPITFWIFVRNKIISNKNRTLPMSEPPFWKHDYCLKVEKRLLSIVLRNGYEYVQLFLHGKEETSKTFLAPRLTCGFVAQLVVSGSHGFEPRWSLTSKLVCCLQTLWRKRFFDTFENSMMGYNLSRVKTKTPYDYVGNPSLNKSIQWNLLNNHLIPQFCK